MAWIISPVLQPAWERRVPHPPLFPILIKDMVEDARERAKKAAQHEQSLKRARARRIAAAVAAVKVIKKKFKGTCTAVQLAEAMEVNVPRASRMLATAVNEGWMSVTAKHVSTYTRNGIRCGKLVRTYRIEDK